MAESKKVLSSLLNSYQGEFSPYRPFAQKKDRAQWEKIPQDVCDQMIAEAQALVGYEYPMIPTTRFMDFLRNGNRTNFQEMFFNRRRVLDTFVIAECCEGKGTYMDDIINGVMAICEESGWLLPSHNRYEQSDTRHALPDPKRPIVDLFAGETAAIVSLVAYLFEDDFNAISPMFIDRMKYEVKRRIEVPYLTEFFWWMGIEGEDDKKLNNWTPWCVSNVLMSTFLMNEMTPEIKRTLVTKACASLDMFIDRYDSDGFCGEGPAYYNKASLALFEALRVLNAITDGHFQSVYQLPKVHSMVTYIMDVHIAKDWYANYSDCSPRLRDGVMKKYLAAKAIQSPEMIQFAAQIHEIPEQKGDSNGINLNERMQKVWYEEEIRAVDMGTILPREDRFFENAQTWIGRGKEVVVAVLGGTNSDPHGHSDRGSFILFKNGNPIFIDPGVEDYSKKTFSPERFTIWTMQTAYHNVIVFGEEHQQERGQNHGAELLDVSCGGKVSTVSYQLASAYDVDVVNNYKRTYHFEKGKELTITDTLSAVPEGTFLPLMTLNKPEYKDGYLYVDGEAIQIDGCIFGGSEEIVFTDNKMKHDWGKSIYRTKMMVSAREVKIVVKD